MKVYENRNVLTLALFRNKFITMDYIVFSICSTYKYIYISLFLCSSVCMCLSEHIYKWIAHKPLRLLGHLKHIVCHTQVAKRKKKKKKKRKRKNDYGINKTIIK